MIASPQSLAPSLCVVLSRGDTWKAGQTFTVTHQETVASEVELEELGMFNPERTHISGETIAPSGV